MLGYRITTEEYEAVMKLRESGYFPKSCSRCPFYEGPEGMKLARVCGFGKRMILTTRNLTTVHPECPLMKNLVVDPNLRRR